MFEGVRKKLNGRGKKGFTLVEMAIVLAVASILFAGLWRLMAVGNTQLRDQAVADQHKQLISSVKTFLASSAGETFIGTVAVGTDDLLPDAQLAPFLPPGFGAGTRNAYNQQYEFRMARNSATSYSFMILTTGGDAIPDSSGGRIASIIGGDGGFIYSTVVCGALTNACGAYGSWVLSPTTAFGYAAASVAGGHVASRTFVDTAAGSMQSWLARKAMAGTDMGGGITDPNTIQTDISLGGMRFYGMGAVKTGDKTASGGAIEGLERLEVFLNQRTLGNVPVVIGRGSGLGDMCDENSWYTGEPPPLPPINAAATFCDDSLQVDGGVSVSGLLQASRLYASQFLYNAPSDRRLKSDIRPIESALEKIASLNGVSFMMKDDKKRRYGVIAQDVKEVFPEIVNDLGQDYIGIDYMGLIGPLVAAVGELKKENEALKEQIAKLNTSMDQLREMPKD